MKPGSAPLPVSVSAGSGRYRLQAETKKIGNDVLVSVWGGTAPHIGSVAMAVPRPSLRNPERTSATVSVFNFTGHKDDTVARKFAEVIAARHGCHTVVTAGIHLEGMNGADLKKLLKNADTLLKRLIQGME